VHGPVNGGPEYRTPGTFAFRLECPQRAARLPQKVLVADPPRRRESNMAEQELIPGNLWFDPIRPRA